MLGNFQSTISYLPVQLFRVAKVAQLQIRTKKLNPNKVIKYTPDANFVGLKKGCQLLLPWKYSN